MMGFARMGAFLRGAVPLATATLISTGYGFALDREGEFEEAGRELPAFVGGTLLLDPLPTAWGSPCVDCTVCGISGHKAYGGDETSWFERGFGEHSSCLETGSCGFHHPPTCMVSKQEEQQELLEVLEDLRASLLAADWASVRALIERRPAWVRYNAARGAIQALGCHDRVLMHIPVSETFLTQQ